MGNSRRAVYLRGLRDGIPIGLGYLTVSFALGLTARQAGLTALQGFVMSWLGMASSGEYAAITVIASAGTYGEMLLVTLVTNARYLLMSFALSQRLSPETGLLHRLLLGHAVTDELFGIAIHEPKPLDPLYSYGSYSVAIPMWAAGTALGVVAGNLLPLRVVSAMSVALFGMFIAVFIPAAKENRVILLLVVLSFACHWGLSRLEALAGLSASGRVVLLTVALSAAAALLFPVKEEPES